MRTIVFCTCTHFLTSDSPIPPGNTRKLEELEEKYDSQFRIVFDAIRQLMTPPDSPPKKIGSSVREA
jgi:hypothetical protein